MVPDGPDEPDYPASPWQIVGLFAVGGVVFLLAVLGGLDLASRVVSWLAG